MKRITFRADDYLIDRARALAKSRGMTLSAVFGEWLREFVDGDGNVQQFDALMTRLKHIQSNRAFSRNEMNERSFRPTT